MAQNWITDRRPTEADGDGDGEVVLRRFSDGRRDSTTGSFDALVDWRHIGEGVPWQHTLVWQPQVRVPAAEPEPPTATPRRFVALSRTVHDFGHTLDAIADDGTAWCMTLITTDGELRTGWTQLTPLPAKEAPANA